MLKRILAVITAIIEAIVPAKPVTPFEDQARALIQKMDDNARAALDQSVDLVEAAATLTIKANATRAYSRNLSGLAGRLEGALSAD